MPKHLNPIYFLLPVEVDNFFAQIEKPKDRLLFKLIYTHGLRVSEVLRLEKKDINLIDELIYIQASKSGFRSWEAIDPDVLPLLQDYLYTLKIDQLFAYTRFNVYKKFRKFAQLAGLPIQKQHPHCLRHSLAVHLARAGATLEQVQAMLRHKSISSTTIYFKILDDQKRELQKSYRAKIKDLRF